MRTADAIPVASMIAPPEPMSSVETLRAAARPDAEIVDGSILRRVDQVELVSRESSLPTDYWARLAISNARQPTSHPPPYWAALEQQRQAHAGPSRAKGQETLPKQHASVCKCDTRAKAPYAGPSLSEVSPVKNKPTQQRIRTIDVLRVHAPAGNIIDIFM